MFVTNCFIYTYVYDIREFYPYNSPPDLSDKIKWEIFQGMSALLYGCTTWTLTNHLERKLDGNHTRMLHVVLNKSRKQHPTKQLYGHLPPIKHYKQDMLGKKE